MALLADTIKTTCGICSAGCGLTVHLVDGVPVRVSGDTDSPLSRGRLCVKGRHALDLLNHPDRLKQPLKRTGARGSGSWQPVSWAEAVEFCRKLDFKGYKGWRLPTIAELRVLVDKKQRNPALPQGHPFSNVLTHVGYWSKTKHKFGPQYVYQMNLWYGKDGYLKKADDSIVWPVRYAEEQNKG